MILLDASVLIAHFAVDDAHAGRAFDVLDSDDELALHPVTVAEVLVRPAREGRAQQTLDRLDAMGIERLIAPRDEPLAIAVLRARTRLKLPDCYVIAAAERTGAALATFDSRLGEVARSRGLAVVS